MDYYQRLPYWMSERQGLQLVSTWELIDIGRSIGRLCIASF
jgi:hypothetical protein